MTAFGDAHDAICERVVFLSKDASPDDLVKLSDAVQKVAYGPQGASTDYRYTAETTTNTTTTTTSTENTTRNDTVRYHYPGRSNGVGFARG